MKIDFRKFILASVIVASAAMMPIQVGATEVTCSSLFETSNWKLIRDRLPEIFERQQDPQITRRVGPSELRQFLIKKLHEETQEFADNPSAEEMADILEVVEALQRHFGLSREEIERVQREKRDLKGGFSEGHVMKLRPSGK